MKEQNNEFVIHPTVRKILPVIGTCLMLLAIFLAGRMAVTFCLGLFADGEHIVYFPGQGSPIVRLQDLAEKEKPPYIPPGDLAEIARVEISVAGDIMMHMPIVTRAKTSEGYYFDDIFAHLKPYLSGSAFSVANLETTLSGTDGREYTGYPDFNSPDDLAPAIKRAGFDMLLTANNHCYDYGTDGLLRTLDVLRSYDLESLGTVEDASSPRHQIRNIGGIAVGMASYTFAEISDDGSAVLNGHTAGSSDAGHINTFDYDHLSRFYTEIEGEIAAMRAGGAAITVLYLHWGDEYSTIVSDTQREIAQNLCNLGVDVIVGSHPHVVQPLDLLYSAADPSHTTVCLYSAGTLLSNLRADNLNLSTAHCEDGVIFRLTLAKYNDGTASVSSVKVLPTWVLVRGGGEVKDFYILPLDTSVTDWAKAYALSEDQLSDAKSSYNRTMALLTPGLNKITQYLAEKNATLDPTLGVG